MKKCPIEICNLPLGYPPLRVLNGVDFPQIDFEGFYCSSLSNDKQVIDLKSH